MQISKWYHLCISWKASTDWSAPENAKFYRDGVAFPSRYGRCRASERRGGEYMTLMGIQRHKEMENRKFNFADKGEMHISGFGLWNRILTDEEIREIGESCQGYTKRNPVVIWDDFVESCKENAESALITPSTCQA